MKIRGGLTLAAAGVLLLVGDLVERAVVVWIVRLFPSARDRILTAWSHIIANSLIGSVKWCGGANIADPPKLASSPGMLLLMNHQSVVDILLAFRILRGGYPRIVTRSRYARGKPLVSHMLRLYEHPIVDPSKALQPQMEALEALASQSRHPIVVFPEGTRSKDGQIGTFRTGALRAILRARPWSVHLLVVDGFWRAGRVVDFLENVSHIRGRVSALGPFPWPAPGEDPEPFIREMRDRMTDRLAAMRRADPDSPPSPALRALVARSALAPLPAEAQVLVDALVGAAGSSLRGVYFFGSRLVGTSPDAHSAYDFVAVVAHPGRFYRALKAAGQLQRPAWLVALFNRWLSPNVIAFQSPSGSHAKCLVLTEADLARATSARARDHFVLGRMSQHVAVAWAPDDDTRSRMVDILTTALRRTLDWASPFVTAPFMAESFASEAIAASYAGEIRPEAAGRGVAVAAAQAEYLREAYGQVLDDAVEAGLLARDESTYTFVRPPDRRDMARARRYFRRSKVRATLRWAKYIVTFDGWLDYIVRKAERRTGATITLTSLERRLPLLLLWPKVFKVLRSRHRAPLPSVPGESVTHTGSTP